MRILHTSDWHLGRTLYGKKRYDEFERFLSWLLQILDQERIDVLLIAGDVFDTGTPSPRAQQLYYRFLGKVSASHCRNVVVVAGNHDSPALLNAPGELLRALNVWVVGHASDRVEEEVIVLRDAHNRPSVIVCAVPYLRDRDIRSVAAGESIDDKGAKLREGIRMHYDAVWKHAENLRLVLKLEIPIIAMGHLFAAGGVCTDGDGVRDLYVGSLAHVSADVFADGFAYVALGHLHSWQMVSGKETVRYSGSPLPMGFGEANQEKTVTLIELGDELRTVSLLDVPCFQKLASISGGLPQILASLEDYSKKGESVWLEVQYEGDEVIADLRERIEKLSAGSVCEILRIRNRSRAMRSLDQAKSGESLQDLSASEVFERCLEAHAISAEQRRQLRFAFSEILLEMNAAQTCEV